MKFKGILKGDTTYRHFDFDDDDVVIKDGESYYKVNYGKNSLEGEFAEDEISYIPCSKVMVLGGKKPKPIVVKEPEVVKATRKPKTKAEPKSKQTKASKEVPVSKSPIPNGVDKFEYYVEEFHLDDVHELQRRLNEFGEEGWELCGFNSYQSIFRGVSLVGVFKRKRG